MRVNNYNAVSELRNKIVDPDPDKSFTRYKFEEILKRTAARRYRQVVLISFRHKVFLLTIASTAMT